MLGCATDASGSVVECAAVGEAGCTLMAGGCETLGGDVLGSPVAFASFLADRLSLRCRFSSCTVHGEKLGVRRYLGGIQQGAACIGTCPAGCWRA
jgi:hypothetical protein